jgi:hypothetical protein
VEEFIETAQRADLAKLLVLDTEFEDFLDVNESRPTSSISRVFSSASDSLTGAVAGW